MLDWMGSQQLDGDLDNLTQSLKETRGCSIHETQLSLNSESEGIVGTP